MHKKGDIREDGKVFWKYDKRYTNGEYWITPERYENFRNIKLNSDRKYYRNNKDKFSLYGKQKYKDNSEEIKKRVRSYAQKNPELLKQRRKEYYKRNKEKDNERCRLYRLKNKEEIKKKKYEYKVKKLKIDALFNLTERIRSLINISIRKMGYTKNTKTEKILGCSYKEFKEHFESLFRDGMSWENRHLWHIDHIIPIHSAKTEEDIIKLNHYTNLQPLWAEENIKKSNKIPATK